MIVLDYYGYHLASKQSELTLNQELFILHGRQMLEKEMNKGVTGKLKKK